jgi:HSP20 family protein
LRFINADRASPRHHFSKAGNGPKMEEANDKSCDQGPSAEMPGLDEKNIEVNVANSVLTVKGQKEEEKVEKKEDFRLRERRFGSFARSVRIPDADADRIEASFKNGVLKVTLPKKPEARKPVKKIEVKGV